MDAVSLLLEQPPAPSESMTTHTMTGFSSFDLHPSLLRGVADLGFTVPTPIQRDGIPPALEGRDILACAMTGSGKTATFALPILHRLMGKKRGVTRVLVLAPTRELAAPATSDLLTRNCCCAHAATCARWVTLSSPSR